MGRANELASLERAIADAGHGSPSVVSIGADAGIEAAVRHWFGAAGDEPVEIVSLLGQTGERIPAVPPPAEDPPVHDAR